ncbi:MAG: TIGR04282 family arsenosugar biosynthesis glycosyltransferase [Mariprofundaceae bacterium]|nr:TIGR04282 family arsenosugar biosynthesis glycosyltransferase [Mariprofundaceae bacterium]
MRDDCQCIIMAKAPVLGHVKTRLTPCYSHTEALVWHKKMCCAVIAQVKALFKHTVLATDDVGHAFWQNFDLTLMDQGTGDLGQRLTHVVRQQSIAAWRPLLFIGTDSPHMPATRLLAAADALQDHDVVIGPVEDGGYNLIGMAMPISGLFLHTDWGTSNVCAQTIKRAEACSIAMLDMHYDIDTPEDLQRLLKSANPIIK